VQSILITLKNYIYICVRIHAYHKIFIGVIKYNVIFFSILYLFVYFKYFIF